MHFSVLVLNLTCVHVSICTVQVDWAVATDKEMKDVVKSGSAYTDAAVDWTVKVRACRCKWWGMAIVNMCTRPSQVDAAAWHCVCTARGLTNVCCV